MLGISKNIEIDKQANRTPDTCRMELGRHKGKRRVIFISQGYHLPRIMYQCNKLGLQGIGYPAELVSVNENSDIFILEKFYIKSKRYIREAILSWLAVLNIYK